MYRVPPPPLAGAPLVGVETFRVGLGDFASPLCGARVKLLGSSNEDRSPEGARARDEAVEAEGVTEGGGAGATTGGGGGGAGAEEGGGGGAAGGLGASRGAIVGGGGGGAGGAEVGEEAPETARTAAWAAMLWERPFGGADGGGGGGG